MLLERNSSTFGKCLSRATNLVSQEKAEDTLTPFTKHSLSPYLLERSRPLRANSTCFVLPAGHRTWCTTTDRSTSTAFIHFTRSYQALIILQSKSCLLSVCYEFRHSTRSAFMNVSFCLRFPTAL